MCRSPTAISHVSCVVPDRVEDLRQAVRSLTDIARVLKQRRAQAGAVELDSVEVKVQMSEDKDVTQIENLIPKEVHVYIYMYTQFFE